MAMGRFHELFIYTTILLFMKTSYSVADTKNITILAPNSVKFECDSHKMNSVYLRKGDTVLVHARIENASISINNSHFKAIFFNDFKIVLELLKSNLQDKGRYTCVATNGTAEMIGKNYLLQVDGKPSIQLNSSNGNIFGGETLSINCHVRGEPAPTVKWKSKGKVIKTEPSNILKITEAVKSDSGVYDCVAENKHGNIAKSIDVIVRDEFPSLPSLALVNRTEYALEVRGKKPDYSGRGDAIRYFQLTCNAISLRVIVKETEEFKKNINMLKPSTTYELELIACNPFVCSKAYSANFTTLEPGKPSQPSVARTLSKGPKEIMIAWIHGHHRKKVLFTRISYAEEKLTPKFKRLDGEENTFSILGLKPFTTYMITVKTCVKSFNDILCSDPSRKLAVTTSIAAPSPPEIVSATNTFADNVEIIIDWKPPKYMNGPAVSYKILFRVKGETRWQVSLVEMGISKPKRRSLMSYEKHVLNRLQQMMKYEVMVSAYNQAGSNNSTLINVITDAAPPHKPLNMTLVAATGTSLTIRWEPPPLIPKVVIVCYHIGVKSLDNVEKYASPICNRSLNQLEIKSLKKNTTYIVSLYASIKRPRDQKELFGERIEDTFVTGFPLKPTEKSAPAKESASTPLILVVVLLFLIVVAISGLTVLYWKRRSIFTLNSKSVFYVNEGGNRPLASRLSMRSTERKPLAIPVEEFPDHVARLHADSDYLFSEEYHSLGQRPDYTWEHSTLHLNQVKNRYQDIVAYDHSRVRLMSIDGVPASNYINANYIDGFQKKPAYIATQAPLNQTMEDFWRMIWEQDVRIIVMLTNLTERGKRKCDQYWPNQGDMSYGFITVRTIEEHKYANYVHRVFSICWNEPASAKAYGYSENEWKIVRQFHFTDWPDFGVPRERATMLSFVQMVRRYMQENDSPTLVHCSAGVGRSGTFIVIEAQIERINRKQNVNVYGYLKNIRSQRNFLVQQEVQYIFVHDAIVDYIKCGLTAIPVGELEETLSQDYFTMNPDTGLSVIEEEWQILNEFGLSEYEMICGKRPCNQPKNRDSYIIPVDSSRVRLTMRSAAEGTDYINASYIDTFLRKNSFIVTQMPLHDTIDDFWRMVWENFSFVILSLLTDEEHNMEDVLNYLPHPDCNPINFGSFEIHCIAIHDEGHFRLRELQIVGRVDGGESERRKLYHYQLLNWHENAMPVADHVFTMIDSIKETRMSLDRVNESHPIVVHCSCGVGRSGIFCALWNIKEQMDDFEETVDVFSVVRLLRRQRAFIIQNKASYEYLYTAAQRYKELMLMYSPSKEETTAEENEPSFVMQMSDEVEKLIENMEEDSDEDLLI